MKLHTPALGLFTIAIATAALPNPAFCQCEPQQLDKIPTPVPNEPNDLAYNFGHDVALSNGIVLIGHPGDGSGSAFVFHKVDDRWEQLTKLTAPDAGSNGLFGRGVSLEAGTALVGAAGNSLTKGAFYVFEESRGVWKQVQKCAASDGEDGDAFGASVDFAGQVAVVGAPGDDDGGSGSGSAYIFARSERSWQQIAKLTADDGIAAAQFGYSVSLSGDTAIVGAHNHNYPGLGSGIAYIFRQVRGDWQQIAKLSTPDGSRFGINVAIDGDTAIVGADFSSGGGAAFVFREIDGSWQQIAKLVPGEVPFASVGFSVDIQGDTALVSGVHPQPVPQYQVHVFREIDGTWQHVDTLVPDDTSLKNQFGFCVALDQEMALVGALGDSDNNPPAAAYVFSICPDLPADFSGDGVVDGADLGLLLAAWGDCPARSACDADLNEDGAVDGADLGLLLAAWTI